MKNSNERITAGCINCYRKTYLFLEVKFNDAQDAGDASCRKE